MKTLRIAILFVAAGLCAAPAFAQSSGDKMSGAGTNGQTSPGTNTSFVSSGSGR